MSRIPTLVIGIGNPLRHDDGAGHVAARRLRSVLPASVTVRESAADVGELLELFDSAERVLLIDAVAGIPDGEARRLVGPDCDLPTGPSTSSHALTLAQIIELARTLGQLPDSLVIYGIGGSDFSAGEGLSQAVEAGVAEVVRRITAELS